MQSSSNSETGDPLSLLQKLQQTGQSLLDHAEESTEGRFIRELQQRLAFMMSMHEENSQRALNVRHALREKQTALELNLQKLSETLRLSELDKLTMADSYKQASLSKDEIIKALQAENEHLVASMGSLKADLKAHRELTGANLDVDIAKKRAPDDSLVDNDVAPPHAKRPKTGVQPEDDALFELVNENRLLRDRLNAISNMYKIVVKSCVLTADNVQDIAGCVQSIKAGLHEHPACRETVPEQLLDKLDEWAQLLTTLAADVASLKSKTVDDNIVVAGDWSSAARMEQLQTAATVGPTVIHVKDSLVAEVVGESGCACTIMEAKMKETEARMHRLEDFYNRHHLCKDVSFSDEHLAR